MTKKNSAAATAARAIILAAAFFLAAGQAFASIGIKGLSLKLGFEGGGLAIGDLKTSLDRLGEDVSGIRGPGNFFGDWEAEVRLDLSRKFSLGIGLEGLIHKQNITSGTLTKEDSGGTNIYTYNRQSDIRTNTPLKLTLYYKFLERKRLALYVDAGLGIYRGRMSLESTNIYNGYTGGSSMEHDYWETEDRTAAAIHAGWGGEYLLSSRVSLVGEFQWRMGKITNFRATDDYTSTSGEETTTQGYLWLGKRFNEGLGFTEWNLLVGEEFPEQSGLNSYTNQGKAGLSLNGLSLKIGVKIGLF